MGAVSGLRVLIFSEGCAGGQGKGVVSFLAAAASAFCWAFLQIGSGNCVLYYFQ